MIYLFDVPISITSKQQALALVGEWLREWRKQKEEGKRQKVKGQSPSSFFLHPSSLSPKVIVTPNPEMIVAAQSDPEFLRALQTADLAIPDGVGIVWALKILQGRRTKDEGRRKHKKLRASDSLFSFSLQPSAFSLCRLSGLDFMESLIGESAKNGWRVLLLGGRPGIAQSAAAKLRRNLKSARPRPSRGEAGEILNLKLKTLSGPQNISNLSKSDNDRLITYINQFQPHLLFVAFGHGKQEKWMAANKSKLQAGVMMGVGGALDQIADPSLRPPAYINSIGLGWLYRLLRQPWRWRRQLTLIKFVGMVIKDRILEGRR